MAENEGKSFFETFGKTDQSADAEKPVDPRELVEEIGRQEVAEAEAIKKAEKDFPAKIDSGETEPTSERETFSEAVLEVGGEKSELVKTKEYWEKFLDAILAEKLAEDADENSKRQAEKILEETVRVLIETDEEKLKMGDATETIAFFRETVLPLIKKRDPEINENEYWDKLQAGLMEFVDKNGIKDLS